MKNNKLFLVILIIIIIMEICTSAILLLYKKTDEGQIVSPSSLEHKTGSGELVITNASELMKLDTGSILKSEIIHVLNQYITNVLPVAYSYQNSTEEELKKVYEENIDEYEKCGLYSYKDLYPIMEMVKQKNIDFTEYESIQFNSTKINNNELTVITSVMYKSGKFITVNLKYSGQYVQGIEIK